ncbi:MAG: LPS assembly protein LptD [Thermodesulfobacteriota bacterium]|jgi:LPS-assembly protein
MRYPPFLLGCLLVFFIIYHPHASDAKMADVNVMKGEGPVDIEADQLIYERDTQTYQAHGHVEVVRGDFSLKADHAQLKMTTKDLVAWENVLLREGEDVVECERLEVNLESRLGKIYRAKLFLKDQNFHIAGKEAEKLGENRYRVQEGSFTTCDVERPPWKFTVKELEVTLQGKGIAKGPVFYLEDIPVLYFPYAIFPVGTDRETGFLLPEVKYSNTYGFEFKEAFFWAFAKDMDATLYFDGYGDRGFKEGLEYRYALARDTKGQANFYFIDDQVFGKNRYAFFIQHEQKLPYDFYLKGDVNHVSDRFYPQDFDEDLPEGSKIDSRSLRELRSVLFGGKNWDQFSFLAEGVVFNDLTENTNGETVQELPQISFYAHPQSLFRTPFFYDLSSSYTNFWRERGVEAYRGDLFPRLSYPMRLFNVLKFESNVGLRETFYQVRDDPTHQFNGWKSRETLEAGAEVSAEFYRVYDAMQFPRLSGLFRVAKWMHTIEPTISYLYSPRVNQEDLPQFDLVDKIPFTNQITYGVTQRLVGKPDKEGIESGPYEYAKLKIFQSYSLGDPFVNEVVNEGKEGKFSNIQAQLWWNFSPYVTGRGDAEFNPYRGDFETLDALIHVRDQRNDAVVAQYRFTRDNIQQVNLLARVRTIQPLYVYGATYYNLLEKRLVENIYGAEYQAQCWTFGVMVDDVNGSLDGTQKRELKFQVYFNLLGIGSVGHKSAYMGM